MKENIWKSLQRHHDNSKSFILVNIPRRPYKKRAMFNTLIYTDTVTNPKCFMKICTGVVFLRERLLIRGGQEVR